MSNSIHSLGAIFSPKDVRDYHLACCASSVDFPTEFSLKMPPVKNQGEIGSCVAHALAQIVEYHYTLETGGYRPFSTGYIYGHRINGHTGTGMYTREAVKVVAEGGDVFNELFDYNVEVPEAITLFNQNSWKLRFKAYQFRFSSYYRCDTVNEIKTALMKHGPVAMAMEWFDDIRINYSTGVMSTHAVHSENNGGHCMVIYGWNEQGWLVQNSWGDKWAKKGTVIIPFNIPLREAWGLCDDINSNDIDKPFSSKIGNFFAKIFNKLIALIDKIKGVQYGNCKNRH